MPSRRQKQPMVLSREQARQLLAQPNRRYPTGLRNYAMMACMYRAGLRCSEVIDLQAQHIKPGRSHILVKDGKGGVDRTVPVEPWLIDTIRAWQDTRAKLEQQRPGWAATVSIFCTLDGNPLEDRYIRAMVKREAVAALGQQIGAQVHPHTLRHTYATELLEDGFTIREVQDLLGHSDVSTTMLYTHVNPVALADKVRRRES